MWASGSGSMNLRTTAKYGDPGAWYHVVIAYDTTQAVEANRVKLYVNGVQNSTFSTYTNYPALNDDLMLGEAYPTSVGAMGDEGSGMWNGCISHAQYVDGLQLAPTEFGEVDSTSGIWKIKTSCYATPGTNGFCLKMEDSSNLDLDSSSNGHTFTTVGTVTATKDNPSNNFCTWNPLDNYLQGATFAYGNTTTTTGDAWTGSTIPIQSGKWYWEVKVPSAGIECVTGVMKANNLNYSGTNWIGISRAGVYGFAGISGNKITSGTAASYDSAISTNDIMMFAMDTAAGSLYVGVNGTWLQSSNPVTSTSPMISSMGTDSMWIPFATVSSTGGACINNFNFGNGYFGTTAVASTNADDAGIGSFEYDVPAGYYALCTNNLGDQS